MNLHTNLDLTLLILYTALLAAVPLNLFTSHYVSINSNAAIAVIKVVSIFTSHYVSINSKLVRAKREAQEHLHPTMYLLIRSLPLRMQFFVRYLHPTMYLLISTCQ